VRCARQLSRGHRELVTDTEVVVGDIADGPLVRRVIREHGIDAVMHFAAYASVGESVAEPRTMSGRRSAHPSGEIGEWHEPETHLIPLAPQAAAGLRGDIEIYGTDYPTPDGTCIRDYIHVGDLAQAHVLGLRYLRSGNPSAAFNLGNGNGFSVREVIAAVKRITGRTVVAERDRAYADFDPGPFSAGGGIIAGDVTH
jgi:UDP-glucose 4-epimerase